MKLSPYQRKMLDDAREAERDAGEPRWVSVLPEEKRTAKSLVARKLIEMDQWGHEYRLTDAGRSA